jgi:ribose 5-phosphate isomerase A
MGSAMSSTEQNQWKRVAAEAAAKLVEDGMVVGLGTGSTAALFVEALARRVAQQGLRVSGIPTSDATSELARQLHVPLTTFAEHAQIDLTVDGADQVEMGTLFLIKGLGGALLREKIVAAASKRMIVVADETKIRERLGLLCSVPVEVVQFGWQATENKLRQIGAKTLLRLNSEQKPYTTDSGNYIIDCAFGAMEKPKEIAHHLDHVTGLVEHGLFLGFASMVLVAGRDGLRTLERQTVS